jgi:hypothetical protein
MKECGDLAHDNLSINVPENGRAELLYSKMMCVVLCFSGREADRGPAGYRPTKLGVGFFAREQFCHVEVISVHHTHTKHNNTFNHANSRSPWRPPSYHGRHGAPLPAPRRRNIRQ